jgi:hypothetical protein
VSLAVNLRPINALPSGVEPEPWLAGCKLIVRHRNSYLGAVTGRFLSKGNHSYLQLKAEAPPDLEPGMYLEVQGNLLIPDGLHDFNDVIRMCNRSKLRKENEKLWRFRAAVLRGIADRMRHLREGVYELGEFTVPYYGPTTISDAETESCNAFALERLHQVLRTKPVDMQGLRHAIEILYSLLNLPTPEIELYSSPEAACRAVVAEAYYTLFIFN